MSDTNAILVYWCRQKVPIQSKNQSWQIWHQLVPTKELIKSKKFYEMTNFFSFAFFAQILFTFCFLVHRFYQPLGSNFIFFIFILSIIIGCYLIWQCLRNPAISGLQKWIGLILGILPFLGLILLVRFLSSFSMHWNQPIAVKRADLSCHFISIPFYCY